MERERERERGRAKAGSIREENLGKKEREDEAMDQSDQERGAGRSEGMHDTALLLGKGKAKKDGDGLVQNNGPLIVR